MAKKDKTEVYIHFSKVNYTSANQIPSCLIEQELLQNRTVIIYWAELIF